MTDKFIRKVKSAQKGSALIMTIVLTVLLAIVAVMFLAVARMDRASTSNIADNKTLDLAAKSIVEIINKELINDTPGVSGQEYYDYPDANNAWLASIEPYVYDDNGTPGPIDDKFRWQQISDVNYFLKISGFKVNDVNVDPPGTSKVIREYPDITLNTDGSLKEQLADADGDGIADSKWIELESSDWSMRSSKGRRIYAAVRVIDNGGMVNINTAHSFDANTSDGNSQMQINLKGLLKTGDSITTLHNTRCGSASKYWPSYEKNVIWNYNNTPDGNYLPFDISDELELKYRYCIDSKFESRFEYRLPQTTDAYGYPGGLYDTTGSWDLDEWQRRITDPNYPDADRRHMLTSYSLDRVIEPNGQPMTNINVADINTLYNKIHAVILDVNTAAQIAVNIIDYRDSNSAVTVFPKNGKDYYGFERPCVYISELVRNKSLAPNDVNTSYAIELFKPYIFDDEPNSTWEIDITGSSPIPLNNDWVGSGSRLYVMRWENSAVPLDINSDPNFSQINLSGDPAIFAGGDTISLTRKVNGVDIVVDSVVVPPGLIADGNHSAQRDIRLGKCIMRLWGPVDSNSTLGKVNTYISTDANTIQAHPKNENFTNIGEIGMIFRKPAYYELGGDSNNVIGYNDPNKLESGVRVNLADADYQQIFKYLTVMDPRSHISSTTETRVKGRININTAPAYVIAQLPWVSLRRNNYNDPNLAKAIVAYRDKSGSDANCSYSTRLGPAGFENIGQLCDVNDGAVNYSIDYYKRITGDQTVFPDLTPSDDAPDDFEERDLIFARISDLVTVRSDVFTAYILVRVGVDGPQKRYMVIFDRSKTTSANKRVKIIAFQVVPEAR